MLMTNRSGSKLAKNRHFSIILERGPTRSKIRDFQRGYFEVKCLILLEVRYKKSARPEHSI